MYVGTVVVYNDVIEMKKGEFLRSVSLLVGFFLVRVVLLVFLVVNDSL